MKITDERYYAELLDQLDDILSVQQRDVIGIICARIRKIGAMNPTSVRQLLRANKAQAADLKAIKAAIAKGTKKSRQEIESIFEEAAKDNADFASAIVEDAAGKLYTESIDQLAAAAARRFRNGVLNLSDTYAFKVDGVDRTIRETYIGAINKAAAAAYTGTMDYNTALRQYIKDMADSGLRVRSFETGKITSTGAGEKVVEWGDPEKPRKTERLDSAMRRAVIESVNVMHQETMKDIADSYPGVFDGYEISAHECPAPDHADIQGKQYTYAEYERMNSRLKRPIGTLGCGHMIFAVAVGKTPPTYSDEELKEMRDRAKKKIEVQGKEYTGYEARQKQREYERLIRKAKERELAFAAAGDDQQARRESEHIRDLYRGYADFSKKAGLRQELTRTGEKSLSYSAKDGSLTKASLRRVGRPEDSGKPTSTKSEDSISSLNLSEYRNTGRTDTSLVDMEEMTIGGSFQQTVDNSKKNDIIKARNMAMGLRTSPLHILTEEEIASIKEDARVLGIDESVLIFNEGRQTAFVDEQMKIKIRGDILPDLGSKIPRDRMSQRAVLAHEYYGHYMNHPSEYKVGDWRDEFRASYDAALNAPNLTDEDRRYLMIDAYDRAKEAGHPMEYDKIAKGIIYGI